MTNIELFRRAEVGDIQGVKAGLIANAEQAHRDGIWRRVALSVFRRRAYFLAQSMCEDARGARKRIADQLRKHGASDTSINCSEINGKAVRLSYDASAGWSIGWG